MSAMEIYNNNRYNVFDRAAVFLRLIVDLV